MNIYILGCTSAVGGADTELWHVIRLWRTYKCTVTVIPTWGVRRTQEARLQAVGVRVIHMSRPCELQAVSELSGGIAVGFCNSEFLQSVAILRQMRCRLAWINCMTYVSELEKRVHKECGPFDAYAFQSQFQLERLAPIYRSLGATEKQFHLIRGAFFTDEFPFLYRPHARNEPFTIGRIARPDPAKWSSNIWPIYSEVRAAEVRARVMAWSDQLSAKCGPPPLWADALKANAESAMEFLSSLHCLLPVNGGAEENWPRAGLEAMSAGVPIVAEDSWGWREMIEHGKTGFLAAPERLSVFATLLAGDEELRRTISHSAREKLVTDLANPAAIWAGWRKLFDQIAE